MVLIPSKKRSAPPFLQSLRLCVQKLGLDAETRLLEKKRPQFKSNPAPPAASTMENIIGGMLTGKAVVEAEPHEVTPPVAALLALAVPCGEAMPPPPTHGGREQDGRATARVPDPRTPTFPADAHLRQSPFTHANVSKPSQRIHGGGGRPRIYADEAAAAAAKKEKQAKRRAGAGAISG